MAVPTDTGCRGAESETVGLATAQAVEAAVDRVVRRATIQFGAWTLGVVGVATAIIIAVIVYRLLKFLGNVPVNLKIGEDESVDIVKGVVADSQSEVELEGDVDVVKGVVADSKPSLSDRLTVIYPYIVGGGIGAIIIWLVAN